MGNYRFLFAVYLIALLSYGIANYIGADVQSFYRVPFLSVKWIDIAIVATIAGFFIKATRSIDRIRQGGFLTFLIALYLLFETVQLYRTWGLNDAPSQISHYLCTLSLFIIIDLSTYTIPQKKIVSFLRGFAIFGAFVLLFSNLYLLYSFVTGNVVLEDLDIRVALEVKGSKETVYPAVLTPYVYAYGLYFLQQKSVRPMIKMLFIAAMISIFAAIVITFHRGTFITVLAITLYFLFASGKGLNMLKKVAVVFTVLSVCYMLFGSILAKKGYDPVEKIAEVAKFTTDTKDEHWDKGRSLSQAYAIAAWEQQPWFGYGYDELFNHGLPENVATAHNGVLTSLFHRGIVGTTILMWILVLLFKSSVRLWRRINKEPKSYQNDMIKLLVLTSFFWIIPFMTQEALWEKFSFCIQMMYFGLIINCYRQMTQPVNVPAAQPLELNFAH